MSESTLIKLTPEEEKDIEAVLGGKCGSGQITCTSHNNPLIKMDNYYPNPIGPGCDNLRKAVLVVELKTNVPIRELKIQVDIGFKDQAIKAAHLVMCDKDRNPLPHSILDFSELAGQAGQGKKAIQSYFFTLVCDNETLNAGFTGRIMTLPLITIDCGFCTPFESDVIEILNG
jgi:hypothetical protein